VFQPTEKIVFVNFLPLMGLSACSSLAGFEVFFRDRPAGTSMWGLRVPPSWLHTIPKEDLKPSQAAALPQKTFFSSILLMYPCFYSSQSKDTNYEGNVKL
jgi:hypothetical protein